MEALFLILFLSTQISDETAQKTLTRINDPIIIKGGQLTALLGVTIPSIRIIAEHNGTLIPVPYQIDEKTRKGEYLFEMVKEGDTWVHGKRDKTRGLLTPQDEVVLLTEDLGAQVPRERWPSQKGMEIEVTDPSNGGKGYAYALSFTAPPGPSPKRYVNFDPDENVIVTEYFAMGFRDPARPGRMNYFAIGNALKGTEPPANIMSAFRMTLHVRLLFGKVNVTRDESQVSSELTAYTNGVVRVLRKIAYSVTIVGKIPSPKLSRVTVTYRHGSEYDNILRIPFKPAILITGADLLISFDFTPVIRGSFLSLQGHEAPFVFDGSLQGGEFGFPAWAFLTGAYGGFLIRLNFDDRLFANVKKTLYIRQEPDGSGEIGWRVGGLEKLKRGRYPFNFRFYGVPDYSQGDEKKLLDIEDQPLRVTVR